MKRLGYDVLHDHIGGKKADRIEKAVEAVHRNGARDAKEGRRAHIVTGNGQAVLRPAQSIARA